MARPAKIKQAEIVKPEVFVKRLGKKGDADRLRTVLDDAQRQESRRSMEYYERVLKTMKTSGEGHRVVMLRLSDLNGSDETNIKLLGNLAWGIGQVMNGRWKFALQSQLVDSMQDRVDSTLKQSGRLPMGPKDRCLVVDLTAEERRLRVGFLPYPPFSEIVEDLPTGLYGSLFNSLMEEAYEEHECTDVPLKEALEDLTRDSDEDERLDCLFGVFESPSRTERGIGTFFAHTHLVSVVGVTRRGSKIHTLDDVTTDPAVEVYCVEGEVGHEFATRVLDITPRVPRLNVQNYARPEEVLLTLRHKDETIPMVAFLDGVSAQHHIANNEDTDLTISLPGLMWYPSGVLMRSSVGAELIESWRKILRRLRMDPSFLKMEAKELRPYKEVICPIFWETNHTPGR